MPTSLMSIAPQLIGGQQLCPVDLAMMIHQFLVLLGLALVPVAKSPSSGLPDVHLCNVSADELYGLDGRLT
jgi:hypothetical protein